MAMSEPDFTRGREEIFSSWPIEKMLGYVITHPPGIQQEVLEQALAGHTAECHFTRLKLAEVAYNLWTAGHQRTPFEVRT